MAVPAGVIAFGHMAAVVADLPVGAEFTTLAVFNIVHDLVLSGVQPVFGPELITIHPEDIAKGR